MSLTMRCPILRLVTKKKSRTGTHYCWIRQCAKSEFFVIYVDSKWFKASHLLQDTRKLIYLGNYMNGPLFSSATIGMVHILRLLYEWSIFSDFTIRMGHILLKAYSQISDRGHSQKFLYLNFLHLLIALPLETDFPEGIEQKSFQGQIAIFLKLLCTRIYLTQSSMEQYQCT